MSMKKQTEKKSLVARPTVMQQSKIRTLLPDEDVSGVVTFFNIVFTLYCVSLWCYLKYFVWMCCPDRHWHLSRWAPDACISLVTFQFRIAPWLDSFYHFQSGQFYFFSMPTTTYLTYLYFAKICDNRNDFQSFIELWMYFKLTPLIKIHVIATQCLTAL